ncbi:MAG: CoA pyrophosphatase [Alphaproteobacteria bacterium]|nr:CoA pyrophosphatase [Alphaproteobacteria bacterium]
MNVTLEGLRPRLLAEAPDLPLRPKRSDYDLDPQNRPETAVSLIPAAVLLPIVLRDEPSVLFTERSAKLARHAGQVSFPGGRSNPDDESLIFTALRETQEETGIAPDFITVAGFLDAYETGTGFAILPVVGLLREGFVLAPDTNEVAEVFEVPLSFLLDPANRQKNQTEWKGRLRHYYAFRYHGHYIWGATAAMLANFAERMTA